MVDLRLRHKLACPKHPRYNPAKTGEGSIRGGCRYCHEVAAIWRGLTEVERRVRVYLADLPAVEEKA